MINSIGNQAMSMPPPPSQPGNQPLSSDQKATIEEILSQYDSDNLSAEDASSIVEAFESAGIKPGEAFAKMLNEEGFSAQEIGDLAGVGPQHKQGPPPPQSNMAISVGLSSMVDYLDAMIEEGDIDIGSTTRSEDIYALLAEKFGVSNEDTLINVTV
ncbi:MAG: hypothetical protein ACRBBR_04610 [Cellvibrionaceae bacterium]